jgi:hypothetical protein
MGKGAERMRRFWGRNRGGSEGREGDLFPDM